MSQNINNILINNFNNVCRTCSQSNNLISIQENIYLIEILSNTVQIQIQLNDELPKKICQNCIQNLNQTYAFIHKCRTTDTAFRHCLTQQKLLNLRQNNKPETSEVIFIKPEISDIDDFISDSDLRTSDECSKDSLRQPEHFHAPEQSQCNPEFEIKNAPIQPETNQYEDACSNFNESFATDSEFVSNLNDCQFTNMLEPMELNESSDDESHDDPLDVATNSIPEKSRSLYTRQRLSFLKYCKGKNLEQFTEDVVLDYFQEKSKTMKPSSLLAIYSMLKSTLIIDDGVDISKYPKLLAFLKRKTVGYKAQVSKSFTKEEVNNFLHEAPDETYLMMKVALIMGIAGGCQCYELMRMTMDHIEDKNSVLIVTVLIPNTNRARTFLITNSESDWLIIYRKYYAYRASLNTEHRRLFVNYKNGKLSNTPVGINAFGKFPKLIAEYLKLASPALYNGHCFKRTSSLLFNKRGGSKSFVIAEGDDFQQ